jgi:hypothetical protein
MFYRSDHFRFAKQGFPALDPDLGVDFVGKPAATAEDHRRLPSTDITSRRGDPAGLDLSGAQEIEGVSRSATVSRGASFRMKPGNEQAARGDAAQ